MNINIEDTQWIIWSTEHRAWWKPNRLGYTTVIEHAGTYTYQEAVEICKQANVFVTDEMGTTPPDELMLPLEAI